MKKIKLNIAPLNAVNVKGENINGVNINGFEIWADGVIYNTLTSGDIPSYIFAIKNEIVKNNKIVLTGEMIHELKATAKKICEKLDKLQEQQKEHTLKFKRLESELENISLLLY